MDLVGGAVDPRGGYVSKILHDKTKESGPVGGARRVRPPRSANAMPLFNFPQQWLQLVNIYTSLHTGRYSRLFPDKGKLLIPVVKSAATSTFGQN